MKEILPQTRHTIHLYGDKHELFFFLNFNISILKYYECSWNKPCLYPWCFYYRWRKIILSAWIYITLGFTIILTLKVVSLKLFHFSTSVSFLSFFFLSAVVIGYMKQPGRLSLAQSHICAHGCRRVMLVSGQESSKSCCNRPVSSAHRKIATDSHGNKQVRQTAIFCSCTCTLRNVIQSRRVRLVQISDKTCFFLWLSSPFKQQKQQRHMRNTH